MCSLKQLLLFVLLVVSAGGVNAQSAETNDTVEVTGDFNDTIVAPPVAADYYESSQTIIKPYSVPDTLAFREVNDSVASALKTKKEFEYANDPAYWAAKPQDDGRIAPDFWERIFSFLSGNSVRAFLLILLIGVVAFIVVRVIIVNKLYIFNPRSGKLKKGSDGYDGQLMADEDLDEKIRMAIAGNDQRSAVRFHYLKTLKMLDKKGWLEFHPEATNQLYRNQVNRYAKGKEFTFLSSVYEYVWYGDFKLTEQQFETVLHNFTHFQHSLKV